MGVFAGEVLGAAVRWEVSLVGQELGGHVVVGVPIALVKEMVEQPPQGSAICLCSRALVSYFVYPVVPVQGLPLALSHPVGFRETQLGPFPSKFRRSGLQQVAQQSLVVGAPSHWAF